MVLQPNCSDLIVSLKDVMKNLDDEEKIKVFKEVEKITGWKLGVVIPGRFCEAGRYHYVPIENYGEIKVLNTSIYLGYPIHKLPEGVREVAAEFEIDQPIPLYTEVCLIKYKESVVKGPFDGIDPIYILAESPFGLEGPILKASQHCYTPHFEPLAKASRHFKAPWWTEDGGSPDDFRKWCLKNGFEDVAKRKC